MRPHRGLTYWNDPDSDDDLDDHMWVVLTDPDSNNPSQVMIVRINSIKPYMDPKRLAVRLEPRDHSSLTKSSYANFKFCRRINASTVQARIESGEAGQRPDMRDEAVARIIEGACTSGDLRLIDVPYLRDQERLHQAARRSRPAAGGASGAATT